MCVPESERFLLQEPCCTGPLPSGSKMISLDGHAVPPPASFSDNDSGECSLILSEREGEIFDFDIFFLKCLEYV